MASDQERQIVGEASREERAEAAARSHQEIRNNIEKARLKKIVE